MYMSFPFDFFRFFGFSYFSFVLFTKEHSEKLKNLKKSKGKDMHMHRYTLARIILCAESDYEVHLTPTGIVFEFSIPLIPLKTIDQRKADMLFWKN